LLVSATILLFAESWSLLRRRTDNQGSFAAQRIQEIQTARETNAQDEKELLIGMIFFPNARSFRAHSKKTWQHLAMRLFLSDIPQVACGLTSRSPDFAL
jgi:hypothetical protein